jgi:hypothetical protein
MRIAVFGYPPQALCRGSERNRQQTVAALKQCARLSPLLTPATRPSVWLELGFQ